MHRAIRWGALLGLAVGLCATHARAAAPVITNTGATASVGYRFYYQIYASNSPTSYGASGLPAGISLDSSRGAIGGTPTAAGSFPVTLSATNADGTGTASVTFTIDTGPSEPPVITNAPTFDSSYYFYTYPEYPAFGIGATNRPQSFGASGLPPGTYFDADLGRIYYNNATPGRYIVTLSATNPKGTGSAQVQWSVHPAVEYVGPDKRHYVTGETIEIHVGFTGPVVVTGTPVIPLYSSQWPASTQPRLARYALGSGTSGLHFTYVVGPDDFAPTGVSWGDISLNGGALTHPSGVSAVSSFPSQVIGEPDRTFNIYGPPVITSPLTAAATVATSFAYSITAKNWPSSYGALGLPEGLVVDKSTGVISGTPVDSGTFSITLQVWNQFGMAPTTAPLTLTISDSPTGRPTIVTQPVSQAANRSESVTFSAATNAPGATYQWQRNGANTLADATGPNLTVSALPINTGIYSVIVTDHGQFSVSTPAILGLNSTAKVYGYGQEIGPDIVHANRNVYDQVLLNGPAATVTADPGQSVRLSFVDFSDDIVQVEFSGAGTLSVVLDAFTGPTDATLYRQPGVSYMRGHAGLTISGADETTNVSVFSVGRVTAVNQTLFRDDVTYDGVADLAFIAILSPTGKFGGIRAANANFWATTGLTGIYAPGVQFFGPVNVCEITATENAIPVLMLGAAGDTNITGGDLLQTNGRAVQVSGLYQLKFVAGTTSHGDALSAKTNRARLEQNGRDVTAEVVVNPR